MVSAVDQQNALLIGSLSGSVPAYPVSAAPSAQLGEDQLLLGGVSGESLVASSLGLASVSAGDGGAALIGSYEQSQVDLYA